MLVKVITAAEMRAVSYRVHRYRLLTSCNYFRRSAPHLWAPFVYASA